MYSIQGMYYQSRTNASITDIVKIVYCLSYINVNALIIDLLHRCIENEKEKYCYKFGIVTNITD